MSTHNMPLNYLIEQLEQDIKQIVFVGLQPDLVSFGFPMTESVKSLCNLCMIFKRGKIA